MSQPAYSLPPSTQPSRTSHWFEWPLAIGLVVLFVAIASAGLYWYETSIRVDPGLCPYCRELAAIQSDSTAWATMRRDQIKMERADADRNLRALYSLGSKSHIVDCPGCLAAGYGRSSS